MHQNALEMQQFGHGLGTGKTYFGLPDHLNLANSFGLKINNYRMISSQISTLSLAIMMALGLTAGMFCLIWFRHKLAELAECERQFESHKKKESIRLASWEGKLAKREELADAEQNDANECMILAHDGVKLLAGALTPSHCSQEDSDAISDLLHTPFPYRRDEFLTAVRSLIAVLFSNHRDLPSVPNVPKSPDESSTKKEASMKGVPDTPTTVDCRLRRTFPETPDLPSVPALGEPVPDVPIPISDYRVYEGMRVKQLQKRIKVLRNAGYLPPDLITGAQASCLRKSVAIRILLRFDPDRDWMKAA